MAGLSNIIKSTIRSAAKSAKSTARSAVKSAAKSELKKGTSSWAKKAHRQIRHEGAQAELKAMDRNLISSKTNKKGTQFFEGKGQQEFINRRGNIARKAAEDKLLYDRGKQKIINVAKKSAIPTAITVGGIAALSPSEGKMDKNFTEILPEDSVEFADWLMNESRNKKVSNLLNTGKFLFSNVTGVPVSNSLSEGTKQQAIALDFKDKNDFVTRDNGIISHIMGYNPGTSRYKWSQFDVADTNTDESILDKASAHPGTYILGRYVVHTDNNGNKYIQDTYDFNENTLEAYEKKVLDGDANTYEKIRYFAPKYGRNKQIPILSKVSKNDIMEWYNQFKRQ